jgi:hypothetical protein
VWPERVVFQPPFFNQHLGLLQGIENLVAIFRNSESIQGWEICKMQCHGIRHYQFLYASNNVRLDQDKILCDLPTFNKKTRSFAKKTTMFVSTPISLSMIMKHHELCFF